MTRPSLQKGKLHLVETAQEHANLLRYGIPKPSLLYDGALAWITCYKGTFQGPGTYLFFWYSLGRGDYTAEVVPASEAIKEIKIEIQNLTNVLTTLISKKKTFEHLVGG